MSLRDSGLARAQLLDHLPKAGVVSAVSPRNLRVAVLPRLPTKARAVSAARLVATKTLVVSEDLAVQITKIPDRAFLARDFLALDKLLSSHCCKNDANTTKTFYGVGFRR